MDPRCPFGSPGSCSRCSETLIFALGAVPGPHRSPDGSPEGLRSSPGEFWGAPGGVLGMIFDRKSVPGVPTLKRNRFLGLILGRRPVYRSGTRARNVVLGLNADASTFSDPKKRTRSRTNGTISKPRGRRAQVRPGFPRSQFSGCDAPPRDEEDEVPSLFQGRRMWPQASRIRRPRRGVAVDKGKP